MELLVGTVAVGLDVLDIGGPHILDCAGSWTASLRFGAPLGMKWIGGILVGVGEAV